MDYCIPICGVASRQYLRSARRHYLVVPRQSQRIWASGICCCQLNCLEFTVRWSAWSEALHWQFQTSA